MFAEEQGTSMEVQHAGYNGFVGPPTYGDHFG